MIGKTYKLNTSLASLAGTRYTVVSIEEETDMVNFWIKNLGKPDCMSSVLASSFLALMVECSSQEKVLNA